MITRTNEPYNNKRPPWITSCPYRTFPLPPLPILPPMKRIPMPNYTIKIETPKLK